jgi:hypothetical protein
MDVEADGPVVRVLVESGTNTGLSGAAIGVGLARVLAVARAPQVETGTMHATPVGAGVAVCVGRAVESGFVAVAGGGAIGRIAGAEVMAM